jgi:hypothetical protein
MTNVLLLSPHLFLRHHLRHRLHLLPLLLLLYVLIHVVKVGLFAVVSVRMALLHGLLLVWLLLRMILLLNLDIIRLLSVFRTGVDEGLTRQMS